MEAATTTEEEVRESGLVEHLEEQAAHFWDVVQGETQRGHRYNTGRVTGRDGYDEGLRLYRLLREMKPMVAVYPLVLFPLRFFLPEELRRLRLRRIPA